MPVLRSDQYVIAVSLDGTPLPGFWDNLTGFEPGAGDLKYRGADGKELALGGPPTIDDGTVSRGYDPVRDDYHSWNANRGQKTVQVTARGKDGAGSPYGPPIVFDGVLQSASLGDIDRAGGDTRMITLNISANSDIG